MTGQWTNPTLPELGRCRIRRTKNALWEAGWEIDSWAGTGVCRCRNLAGREMIELSRMNVEVLNSED